MKNCPGRFKIALGQFRYLSSAVEKVAQKMSSLENSMIWGNRIRQEVLEKSLPPRGDGALPVLLPPYSARVRDSIAEHLRKADGF